MVPSQSSSSFVVRPVVSEDIPGLRQVIDATELFPSALLEGMAAPYLYGEDTDQIWLTIEAMSSIGIAYASPEKMTMGTWNIYLIAIDPSQQRQGLGAELVRAMEAAIIHRGGRLLLVETSGLPSFAGSRNFYRACGFGEEARIRDFYRDGDDKVVFRKVLPEKTS